MARYAHKAPNRGGYKRNSGRYGRNVYDPLKDEVDAPEDVSTGFTFWIEGTVLVPAELDDLRDGEDLRILIDRLTPLLLEIGLRPQRSYADSMTRTSGRYTHHPRMGWEGIMLILEANPDGLGVERLAELAYRKSGQPWTENDASAAYGKTYGHLRRLCSPGPLRLVERERDPDGTHYVYRSLTKRDGS